MAIIPEEIFAAIERSALSDAGKAQGDQDVPPAWRGRSRDSRHADRARCTCTKSARIDSIIDIVGAVFALEWFKADRIVVSPINVGGGMVRIGARRVSGAGAGHARAPEGRAGVFERDPDGVADADRRADPDGVRVGVWPGAGDDGSTRSATAPAIAS